MWSAKIDHNNGNAGCDALGTAVGVIDSKNDSGLVGTVRFADDADNSIAVDEVVE